MPETSTDTTPVRPSRLRRAVAALPASGAPRALAVSTLVGQTGSGLLLPVSALFFTRSVGLSAAQVGLGLAVAGIVGLAAGVPLGRVADRFGARGTYAGALCAQAAATASFTLVHSMGAFVAAATLAALAERGGSAARGAVIGSVGTGEARVRLRALLRSVTNVGLSIGTASAGLVLAADTRTAYVTVVLLNAAAYVLAALPLVKVPAVVPVTTAGGGPPRRAVLRNRPYAVVTALCGITSIHYDVLSLALPLWIASHTAAPKWSISAVILANTVLVVLLQVPFSRGTGTVEGAAMAIRRSGGLLWAAWILIGCVTFTSSAALAVALLVAGMAVHTAGELWHAAGSYGLSYELAPAGSHGEYQGFFSLGRGAAGAVAPLVLTTACLAPGPAWRPVTGWIALGAVVAVASLAVPAAARRAAIKGSNHAVDSTPADSPSVHPSRTLVQETP